jgi:DUF971 family protein
MLSPDDIQIVNDEVAIRWSDGQENYFPMQLLRAASPSAENVGEPDLLGRRIGGAAPRDHTAVRVNAWEIVGGYAIRFIFSDGHSTGLYAYDYLRELWRRLESGTA